MNKFYFSLIFCLINLVSAAQDIHQQPAKSVEELLHKNLGNQAIATFNGEKYLVLENLRNASRKRIFVGDQFRFKTKEDIKFQEEVQSITDSTFVISWLNPVMEKYEYREIRIDEVVKIYRKPLNRKINLALDAAPIGYLAFDWIQFGLPPWKNPEALKVAAFLYVGKFALMNVGKLFNGRKISENYRLRVIGGRPKQ